MTLDQMVAALFDLRDLPHNERTFIVWMVRATSYTDTEAAEIRRLHRRHFGYMERIKGQQIEDPPLPE